MHVEAPAHSDSTRTNRRISRMSKMIQLVEEMRARLNEIASSGQAP
jgi:hypothetical protein